MLKQSASAEKVEVQVKVEAKMRTFDLRSTSTSVEPVSFKPADQHSLSTAYYWLTIGRMARKVSRLNSGI